MILLSNGGHNTHRAKLASDTIIVGTVDGIAVLSQIENRWAVTHRALAGCNVSAVTAADDGTLFAATHGVGVARSRDGGITWQWINTGIDRHDLWAARAGKLQGKDVVLVGSLPAHLYISEDAGDNWRELTALRNVASVEGWCFPPPPRIGHVKEIVLDGDRLMVGIEIGALLVSTDFGKTFTDMKVDPIIGENDIHRILVNPARPNRILIANGIVGVMTSDDNGKSWRKNPMPPEANYPDPMVIHPDQPDLVFLTAGVGWPPPLVQTRDARAARCSAAAMPAIRGSVCSAVCRTDNARRSARSPSRFTTRATASMPPTPTARFSKVLMAATTGASLPMSRPCRKASSIAGW